MKSKKKDTTTITSKWVKSKPEQKIEDTDVQIGIFDSIKKMYMLDIFVFFIALVLILFTSFLWNQIRNLFSTNFQSKWILAIETVVNMLIQVLWRLVLTVVIEIINMVHIKKLTSKIHTWLEDKAPKSSRPRLKKTNQSSIMSRLHTYSFFILLPLQLSIIDYILPWTVLRLFSRFIHNSILYSFYSFDYPWTKEGIYFESRLKLTLENMAYFMGYGLVVGLIQSLSPEPLGLGTVLTILMYPLLVVNAYRVDLNCDKYQSVRLTARDSSKGAILYKAAKWLLTPSLLGCRVICSVCDKAFEYGSR